MTLFSKIRMVVLSVLTLTAFASAQWSSDPMQNLALADQSSADQVQPKVKPLPNNGWYVSWFDANPNLPPPVGYNVQLQRLSAEGVERLPHDGIQVADLSNSSTEDYGLDFDTKGNALLAFLDTREGSNQQVTAARISPNGAALWGKLGVQLTSGSDSFASPKIAGTTDGGIVVAWIDNSSVVLQKLSPAGHPLWGKGIHLTQSGYNFFLADLHAADNGSVIVSWVREKGFGSDAYLEATKISANAKPLWGTTPTIIYNGGSLQFGEFPYFISDGSGGAVFAWYSNSPSLQCFAQHIRADGTAAFPANGAVASTNTSNVRVSPSVSYDAATDETFLFWTEEDSQQVYNGVYAQKFDSAGNLKWGQDGLVVVPLGDDQQIFVRSVQIGGGALAFWVDQQSYTSATIQATRINNSGRVICPQFAVSSFAASKAGLAADIAPSGLAAVAFQDYRNGNSDIYIQNVNDNCTLGPKAELRR